MSYTEIEVSKSHSTALVKRPEPPMLTLRPDLPPTDADASLRHFVNVISRQRWKLLAFMGLAAVAAIALQLTLPKLYEAAAIVKVDRHAAGGAVGEEAAQLSTVDDMDQVITTQMELALSDPVLRPIAERYHLLEIEKQLRGLSPQAEAVKRAAPIELKHLNVTRPPNTYLIRIAYRAYDPHLAAEVANAIAANLADHANGGGNASYTVVSGYIARELADLHSKMEQSTTTLASFEKELNMVDPVQRTTVLSSRLSQLNTEYTTAQAERLRWEAILDSVSHSKTLGSAQVADLLSQNTLLNDAVGRLNQSRQQFASIQSFYGPTHPEYQKAKKQVEEAQNELDQLQAVARDRAQAQYNQAKGREQRLHQVVEQAKTDVDALNARALQYEQLQSEADNNKKLYEELETRTKIADINSHFHSATVEVAAAALVPAEPIFPKLMINLPLALILSCILGILGAVLASALDTTFSDPEDVATRLNLDVLTTIPATKRMPAALSNLENPLLTSSKRSQLLTARYGEAIRTLRTALNLIIMERPIRTLLVTSANPGEGKTTTAAHLAVACSQVGKKVLLIDADLRRPSLHKVFGVTSATGVSDVLTRDVPIKDATVQLEPSGLSFMAAGPISRRATDLVSVGFAGLLDQASREFDLVIVDSAPLLGVPEAQELAGTVDSVILVTKAHATTGRAVTQSLNLLNRAGANVLGLVMNQVKRGGASGYQYYYYYSQSPETEKASGVVA